MHAAVVERSKSDWRCPQGMSGDDFAGAGMLLIGCRQRHDRLVAAQKRLALQPAEETSQSIIVFLPPAVGRMVMTLGTFDPHSQEYLADAASRRIGRLEAFVERRRPFGFQVAFGGDDVAD
jgi:hypothetical protein